jgi:hypothetical protein
VINKNLEVNFPDMDTPISMTELITFYTQELAMGSNYLFEKAGVAISKDKLSDSDGECKEDTNESDKNIANLECMEKIQPQSSEVIELD